MRAALPIAGLILLSITPLASGQFVDSFEVSVTGSYLAGAFGADDATDIQSTIVGFTWGDETQVRVDVPWTQIRSASSVPAGALGPVPVDPRRQGAGDAAGNGPNGPGGPGQDPGGANPGAPPTEPEAVLLTGDEWVSGVGDLRLGLGHRLFGGGAKLFRVDVDLDAKVPTADETENLGTGELDLRFGVSGEYEFWLANAFGGVGFNRLGDPEWVELNDVIDAFAGLESQPLADRLVVYGWVQANEAVTSDTGSPALVGIGLRGVGRMRWRAQVTTGLSGPTEDFGASVGVAYGLGSPRTAIHR